MMMMMMMIVFVCLGNPSQHSGFIHAAVSEHTVAVSRSVGPRGGSDALPIRPVQVTTWYYNTILVLQDNTTQYYTVKHDPTQFWFWLDQVTTLGNTIWHSLKDFWLTSVYVE